MNNAKLLLVLTLTILLSSCGSDKKNYGKYVPKLNPHPKYYMTIKGHIDPRLKDKVHLKWITRYYTSNDACKVVINALEGVSSYQQKTDVVKIKPNKKGSYFHKIPLDKYLPGYCKWQAETILYAFNKNKENYNASTAVIFKDSALIPKRKTAVRGFICADVCHLNKGSFYMRYEGAINSRSNYVYRINFRGN